MRKAFLISLLLSACALPWGREYTQNPDPNHTHADFAVWMEGEKIDFSASKYMSGLPTNEETPDETDQYRHKHLHLHDEIGSLLHRHKPGLPIGEFLQSLGFTMSTQCLTLDSTVMICPESGKKWQMFVNGEQVPYDAAYAFEDIDQILLTYGASAEDVQKQLSAMTDEACLFSRTCLWRGDPPAENCIADPEVPCVAPLD